MRYCGKGGTSATIWKVKAFDTMERVPTSSLTDPEVLSVERVGLKPLMATRCIHVQHWTKDITKYALTIDRDCN